MDDQRKTLLIGFIEQNFDEIADRAADWATTAREDVAPNRPRAQVRGNYVRYLNAILAQLRTGEVTEITEFMRYVSELRARSDFHISTMMRASFSVRNGIGDVLRRLDPEPRSALAILEATDEIVQGATIILSDLYADAVHRTLLERRAQLEAELHALADEKLSALAAQRQALNDVSLPIIEVWHGILVAPLIGDFDGVRIADVRDRVVGRVVETRSAVVLVDMTGLSLVGPELADELGRLVACVRLVGSEAMLVGVTPHVAAGLADLDSQVRETRSFSTLRAGLRAAFRLTKLRVVKDDPSPDEPL